MTTAGPASMRQVLDTLAALAPDPTHLPDRCVDLNDLVTLPLSYTSILGHGSGLSFDPEVGERVGIALGQIDPIVKRARLHAEEHLLRVGWLWVTGHARNQEIRFPLVSMAVRTPHMHEFTQLVRGALLAIPGYIDLVPTGDAELTDAVTDPELRLELSGWMVPRIDALSDERRRMIDKKHRKHLDDVETFATRVCAAAGFDRIVFGGSLHDDIGSPKRSWQRVVPQIALYLGATTVRSATIAAALRSWPVEGIDTTAFAALYRPGATRDEPAATAPVESALVLTPAQRDAVHSTRANAVTVISGPPGSGKTQTIAAIALDAVEHGRSVLVTAPSTAAVDAMIDLLGRTPGPEPIVFGSDERRTALATRLTIGGGALATRAEVDRARDAFEAAHAEHAATVRSVTDLLRAEQLAGDADAALLFHHRSTAPRWFEPAAPLAEADMLLAACRERLGLLGGVRMRRRHRRLVRHAGAATADLDQLDAALRTAVAIRASNELQAGGGLDLDALWPKLVATDDALRTAKASWLDASMRSEQRIDGKARSTMGLVATALRAGRAVRRDKLGEIDGERLTGALPLWAGTLRDIDDLLPRTAAMFDLVIVDEATQVDQITATPALLRAKRCVVAGDAKQLRHVSFVSDDAIRDALATTQVTDPDDAGRLDVRRVSLFDLAAAAAPTRVLDQHFRSAPHLISFSARRFYEGKVTIATTHPRNDDLDCISVDRVDGQRSEAGVNAAELERVLAIVRERQMAARAAGTKASIGVLSPFRSQAEAIEAAIVEQLSLEEIDELDLRVGTVHGFQGCERELVIISLALDPASSPNTRGFVTDPNLFNVMITRAREEIVVVTSLPLDTPGLLGEYLRHGDAPPAPPRSARSPRPDVAALADDLAAQGVAVAVGYPSGPHVVDLVLGGDDDALGVLFGVHADGVDAHVERHLQLRRAGWQVREVFDSKWADRRAELALELAFGHTGR